MGIVDVYIIYLHLTKKIRIWWQELSKSITGTSELGKKKTNKQNSQTEANMKQ